MLKHIIHVTLNGEPREWTVYPNDLLLNVLREQEFLTGTKYGCGIGECGACTVQINGQPILSCLVLAVSMHGAEILTVEGLARDGQLHPVQEGFWEKHGLQCGYCTPGMILSGVQLLARNPKPTRDEIVHALEGNLCRCTGYSHIIDAIEYASKKGAKR